VDYTIEYLADRPATIAEVGDLKYGHWKNTSPDRPYDVWIDEIRYSARRDAFPMTLVAIAGDELLGFVTLVEMDEHAAVADGLWMITLYVKLEHRRQGIGEALMGRCTVEARRLGYGALHLWTDGAELTGYYAHRGWRLIGRDDEGDDVMVCGLAGA